MIFKVFVIFGLVAAGSLAFTLPSQQIVRDDDANELQYYSQHVINPANEWIINEDDLQDVVGQPLEEEVGVPEVLSRARRSPQKKERGSIGVTVDNKRGYGTDVRTDANARLWQSNNGRSTLDGNAYYQRHFGGQMGTGRKDVGAGLNFRHRF